MRKEEKAALIAELKEKLESNQTFYLMDGSGMTVAQSNAFRRACFSKGVDYKVYKNTFIKKALEQADGDFPDLSEALVGFSGIMFSGEIGNLPAKVVKEYRKKSGDTRPVLKAASIEFEAYFGEDNLEMLSEMKSKNELIADVLALLQSPAKNVIGALQSGGNTIAGLVKALEEKQN